MSNEREANASGRPRVGARTVVASVLAVQVMVPAVLLFAESKPAPFGWQMYAQSGNRPAVDVVHQDGTVSDFDPNEFNLFRREIEINVDLLKDICDLDEDISAFRVHEDGAPSTEFECSR